MDRRACLVDGHDSAATEVGSHSDSLSSFLQEEELVIAQCERRDLPEVCFAGGFEKL